MLHIGDNCVITRKDIVIIMPGDCADGCKSRILMADGSVVCSTIAATTLKKRLESSIL